MEWQEYGDTLRYEVWAAVLMKLDWLEEEHWREVRDSWLWGTEPNIPKFTSTPKGQRQNPH